MDLAALADFNLVARHGGFGRAARATGRPKATLSRRVAELEASLGIRLLERGPRGPRLTEEGRVLHERTAALLHEVGEAADAVASGTIRQPRGLVRVSAPQLFAQLAMGRLAAGFALAYPEVRLEVVAEDRAADLVEDGFDLAIRVNPRPEPDLVGRRFLRDRLLVVAPPGLPRPMGAAAVPAVVLGRAEPGAPWRATRDGASLAVVPEPRLGLSSLLLVRDAVRAGVGAAVLPMSLVGGDLARGRLASWGEVEGGEVELWALHTSRRLQSPRLLAFLRHLAQAFPTGAPEELAAFVDGIEPI